MTSEIQNNHALKNYFRESLEMDEEEFERRYQMYLELFPFIALDFRLRKDCSSIHQSAKTKNGEKILSTKDINPSYVTKAEGYRKDLIDIRESLDVVEFEIGES